MATARTLNTPSASRPETVTGMVVSLLFWLSLLGAGVLFALVSLSPKLQMYLRLHSQFIGNQKRLVALEQQTEELQRVIDAIRSDADFAAELTRIEFDAVRPGEEVIPVEPDLKLDPRAVETTLPDIDTMHETYEPIVTWLASDSRLRIGLLSGAMLLVVLSFAILQPANTEPQSSSGRSPSLWQNLHKRYARQS